jgi:hypothetical protein
MDKISGYVVANSKGGYDVINKTSTTNTKSFTIPTEELASEKQTQKTLNNASTNPFKAGSFDFKNWCANLDTEYDRQMLTQTEGTRSDEEILKDMAELARKHAQQGTFQESDKEFLALMEEYISSVSPDRESILNRTMNEIIDRTKQEEDYAMSDIYQQINAQGTDKKEKDEKELIDYFIEMLANKGKGKGSSGGVISSITQNGDCTLVTIDHGGGMTTELGFVNGELIGVSIAGNNYFAQLNNSGTAVENGMIKDDNGEVIAIFGPRRGSSDFRFHAISTNAEVERRKEILAVYNESFREYKVCA